MSNENQLTESQLFTIEALNKIQGFVWPEGARFAAMDFDSPTVAFYAVSTQPSGSSFHEYGYINGCYTVTYSKHPDWRNSMISKEQFYSVDGWVRHDNSECPTNSELQVQVKMHGSLGYWPGYPHIAKAWPWVDGGITHWRYHKRDIGWYLVKRYEAAEWEPAEYVGNGRWLIAGVDSNVLLGDDDLIINESRLLITSEGCVVQK
nr:hypothetical protein [Plesiomonas shigelloides]